MNQSLRPHQATALRKLHNGQILWGGVGSGKSRVAVEYYMENELPKPVIVITTAKKRDSLDWNKEFADKGIGKGIDFVLPGENKFPETKAPLIIDSWNNIHKYVDFADCFFIFDEQKLVGKGTWVKSFLKIAKLNTWIMLSGTPGDTWMDYIPVFIANGFYKNRTEFIREHVVYAPYTKYPKVVRYLNTKKLEKQRAHIILHMPHPKLTVRHSETVYVEHNEELLQHVIKHRWHIYQNRPIRDIAELFSVMRRVVNDDPSRIRAIRKLLSDHPKMVVFYNFDYELEALRALGREIEVSEWNGYKREKMPKGSESLHLVQFNAGAEKDKTLALAEWNGHNHEQIPDFESWAYLVQYVAGAEGWNCTETNAISFYSLTYSYKLWEQAHGRIDRLDTPFIDLYYHPLRSKSVIDRAIWESLKAKKSFNAGKYPISTLLEA
jgi:hypothetical protein